MGKTEKTKIKIICLNGSPHIDGNTRTLMDWVADGCRNANALVEYINLVDYDIKYCRGCFTCIRTGKCLVEDDCDKIISKLINCDGIIVGSPVYEGHTTALLKTFLDRITMLNLYTDTFYKQYSVGVATSGVAPYKKLAAELSQNFGKPVGYIGAKTATLKHAYQDLKNVHKKGLEEKAKKLGEKLVYRIIKGKSGFSVKGIWISILRKLILKPMVLRNKEQFCGVIEIWKDKKWI